MHVYVQDSYKHLDSQHMHWNLCGYGLSFSRFQFLQTCWTCTTIMLFLQLGLPLTTPTHLTYRPSKGNYLVKLHNFTYNYCLWKLLVTMPKPTILRNSKSINERYIVLNSYPSTWHDAHNGQAWIMWQLWHLSKAWRLSSRYVSLSSASEGSKHE